jgi:hypothetical protein
VASASGSDAGPHLVPLSLITARTPMRWPPWRPRVAWAAEQLDMFTEAAREYLTSRGPFPSARRPPPWLMRQQGWQGAFLRRAWRR